MRGDLELLFEVVFRTTFDYDYRDANVSSFCFSVCIFLELARGFCVMK